MHDNSIRNIPYKCFKMSGDLALKSALESLVGSRRVERASFLMDLCRGQ